MIDRKVLFVVGRSYERIGGHKISAIHIAKSFASLGYQVGLLGDMDIQNSEVKEALLSGVGCHIVPFISRIKSYILRPLIILKIFKENNYNVLVCMDNPATIQAGMTFIITGAPVVQVIAGGPVVFRPILNIPGIIVFSRELLIGIPKKYRFPIENLLLSEGRVAFNQFRGLQRINKPSRQTRNGQEHYHIAFVSRLDNQDKAEALLVFFTQIEKASTNYWIHLTIIGDGEYKKTIEKSCERLNQNEKVEITFIGEVRVGEEIFETSDLIVGQGRTVIESIASGVPAAVCGRSGYFGLLNIERIKELSETNLTGRGKSPDGNLLQDLDQLPHFKRCEMEKVYKYAVDKYASIAGAKRILVAANDIEERYSRINHRKLVYAIEYLLGIMVWTFRTISKSLWNPES